MGCQAHQYEVGRAIALVEARAGVPITISELCRAADVSERTLRNAFHDVYGVSPKQYLTRRALEQAHEALLLAHGARGAVTHAAMDCGFFELGRFAGSYRRVFGEYPSDTVRHAAVAAE